MRGHVDRFVHACDAFDALGAHANAVSAQLLVTARAAVLAAAALCAQFGTRAAERDRARAALGVVVETDSASAAPMRARPRSLSRPRPWHRTRRSSRPRYLTPSLGLCEARPKCISPSRTATLTVELDVGVGVDPAGLGYQIEFQGETTLTSTPPSSTVYFVEPATSTLVLEFEDFGPPTTGTFDVRVRSVATGIESAWSPWASVVF